MSDIIISFLAWWNGAIALLKFFIQIVAFCLPLLFVFSVICFIIILLKVFLSKYFDFDNSNIEDEGETDLNLDNNENEEFKTKN